MIRHAHNWAITTDYFNSCKSLVDFFDIIGVDDGLPQGYEANKENFEEFPTIIQAKNYPIHAWLTHPESPYTKFYKQVENQESAKDSGQLVLDKGVEF